MKRILSLIGVVLVVGCGPEPRDLETLQELNGLWINPSDGQPHTGPVFGMEGDVKVMTSSLKDGVPVGLYESYFENGQLMDKRFYKDGVRDGLFERYFDNGQLSTKGTYKDGVEDGPFEFYLGDGQLFSKGTYKNGKIDGPYERYYENGQLEDKGTYKDGVRCGEWIEDGETVTYDPC